MRDRERILLIALRQALITFLCALEDYLGMPRSMPNRRERRKCAQAIDLEREM